MNHSPESKPHGRHRVLILGAGFGGLRVAKDLRRAEVDVVIVDRQNHHLFQPLLYQVATAGLAGPDIASPVRRILRRNRNARVLYGEITRVDPDEKVVYVGPDALPYDTLVVATGATHSYFGRPDWERIAPGLKTLRDAQEIRARILRAFEFAERQESDVNRKPWLRFVVVGGGPTGVELAGALAELSRKILPRDFRSFDSAQTEILLLEGGDRILAGYPPELSASAVRQLERLGASVRTGALVTEIDDDGVTVSGDEKIDSKTVLWAAGVQASPLLAAFGVELDRAGRMPVTPELEVPGHPSTFVIGDAAHFEQDGHQIPGVAPAALQMGKHTAKNIRRRLEGEELKSFHYRDKGSMATIGRASAVARLGERNLSGWIAWMAWLFVHLLFLVGFRSRLVVLINWLWAYVGYRPAARVLAELADSEVGGPTTMTNRPLGPATRAERDRNAVAP